MSNSVKLLNYVEPVGDYLRFYTQLSSELKPGDLVFIKGGNYDNSQLASEEPFNEFSIGFEVLQVGGENDNSITLNITRIDPRYNNITQGFFSPKSVYISEEESFKNPNKTKEAWISKGIFNQGEFNGGTFENGIFGEYKKISNEDEASWQQEVESLDQNAVDFTRNLNKLYISNDFSEKEVPIEQRNAWFNRNKNSQAEFRSGVFLGGNFISGQIVNRYNQNKSGLIQNLNNNGGIENEQDESLLNITRFENNNQDFGWTIFASGNMALDWAGELDLEFTAPNQIKVSFLPYQVLKSFQENFIIQLDVSSNDPNNSFFVDGIYTVKDLDVSTKTFTILEDLDDVNVTCSVRFTLADPDQFWLDPKTLSKSDFELESLLEKTGNESKHVKVKTGTFQDISFYNGLWSNARLQGGNWYNGQVNSGRINSTYGPTTWNYGLTTNLSGTTLFEDVAWKNGIWDNGTWDGSSRISIEGIILENNLIYVQISDDWLEHSKKLKDATLYFLKESNSSEYLDSWSFSNDQEFLEFRKISITNVNYDAENSRILLTTDIEPAEIEIDTVQNFLGENVFDLNYGFSRLGVFGFDKGLFNSGTWQAGTLNPKINVIESFSLNSGLLEISVQNVDDIFIGDLVSVSNLRLVRQFDYDSFEAGTNADLRKEQEYWQTIDQKLFVEDVDPLNNTIFLNFENVSLPADSGMDLENSSIVRIEKVYELGITAWSDVVWQSGTFSSGTIEGLIWLGGNLESIYVKDPTVNKRQTLWRFGVWIDGEWNNGVFQSGNWFDGTWQSGIMQNGYNQSEQVWGQDEWQYGDSVWFDGIWNSGQWLDGMWISGSFNGGSMLNSGINSMVFNSGRYLNGTSYQQQDNFSQVLNQNSANGSAPSLISIQKDGWVQFDQNTSFQKNYNLIFKDLNKSHEVESLNPWNDQQFTVLDRNTNSDRIKITTSGVDVNQDEIDTSLPILVSRKTVGVSLVGNGRYWIADSEYDRVVQLEGGDEPTNITSVTHVLGFNQDKVELQEIKHMISQPSSRWVYFIEGNRLTRVEKTTRLKQNLVDFSDLQISGISSIVETYKPFLYPSKSLVPETVIIPVLAVVRVGSSFQERINFLAYKAEGETGISRIDTSTQNSFWDTFLQNQNWNDAKIKSYIGVDFNLLIKVSSDYDFQGLTLDSNDVQRVQFSYNTLEQSWVALPDLFANELNTLGRNPQNQILDFAVAQEGNSYDFWYLYNDGFDGVNYFSGTTEVPLVDGLSSEINEIEIEGNRIVCILGDRTSSQNEAGVILLPETTDRVGFEVLKGNIKHVRPFDSVPTTSDTSGGFSSSDLEYWYFDGPSIRNRLILIEEDLQDLYRPEFELGVTQGYSFEDIKSIHELFDGTLIVETLNTGEKLLSIIGNLQTNPSKTEVILPSVSTNGYFSNTTSFIDSEVYGKILWILYSIGSSFYFDRIDLDDPNSSDNVFGVEITGATEPVSILGSSQTPGSFPYGYYVDVLSDNRKQIKYLDFNTEAIYEYPDGLQILDVSMYNTAISSELFITLDDGANKTVKKSVNLHNNRSELGWPSQDGIVKQQILQIDYDPFEGYQNIGGAAQLVHNFDDGFAFISKDSNNRPFDGLRDIWNLDGINWVFDASNTIYQQQQDVRLGIPGNPWERFDYVRKPKCLHKVQYSNQDWLIWIDVDESQVGRTLKATRSNGSSSIFEMAYFENSIETIVDLNENFIFDPVAEITTSGTNIPTEPGTIGGQELEFKSIAINQLNSDEFEMLMLYADANESQNYILEVTFSPFFSNVSIRELPSLDFKHLAWDGNQVWISTAEEIFELESNNTLTQIYDLGNKIDKMRYKNNEIQVGFVTDRYNLLEIDPYVTGISQRHIVTEGIFDDIDSITNSSGYVGVKNDGTYQITNQKEQFDLPLLSHVAEAKNYWILTSPEVVAFIDKSNVNRTEFTITENPIKVETQNDEAVLGFDDRLEFISLDSTSTISIPHFPSLDYEYFLKDFSYDGNKITMLLGIRDIVSTSGGSAGTNGNASTSGINYEYNLSGTNGVNISDVFIYDLDANNFEKLDFEYQVDENQGPYSINADLIDVSNEIYAFYNAEQGNSYVVELDLNGTGAVKITNTAASADVLAFLDGKYILNIDDDIFTQDETTLTFNVNGNIVQNAETLTYWFEDTDLVVKALGETSLFIGNTSILYAEDAFTSIGIADVEHEIEIRNTRELGDFATDYDSNLLFEPYDYMLDDDLLSPYATARIVFNTLWRGGNFNQGADANENTAHFVSSTWRSGDFNGTWDLPDYIDHVAKGQNAYFIQGNFGSDANSIWNGGTFVGGTWNFGEFRKGHFIADLSTQISNIILPEIPFNRITNLGFDTSRSQMYFDIEHITWDENINAFVEKEPQISKLDVVMIPNLFKNLEIEAIRAWPGKYEIEGKREVVLEFEMPNFDVPSGWLEGRKIYLKGGIDSPEFFHGLFDVIDSYEYQNKIWITINSEFNQFSEEGFFQFTESRRPTLSVELFIIQDVELNDLTRIYVDLPLTNTDELEFIKNNLLLDSVYSEIDSNEIKIASTGHLYAYDRSMSSSANRLNVQNVSYAKNVFLQEVSEFNFSNTNSQNVFYGLHTMDSSVSLPNIELDRSLIYSGSVTAGSISNSANLNLDDFGFSYGESNVTTPSWISDFAKIISFTITSDGMILELDRNFDVQELDTVWIRGFNGSRSKLVGATRSSSHVVISNGSSSTSSSQILIRNPFNGFVYDPAELKLFEQSLLLPDGTNIDFDFSYVSKGTWNGGELSSNNVNTFSDVFNAGLYKPLETNELNTSQFNGEWFGTPESYYYAGFVDVSVVQSDSLFELSIDLNSNGFDNWKDDDLVRVEFIDSDVPSFYTYIKNQKISSLLQIFYDPGVYIVQITRMTTEKNPILDIDAGVGPEKDATYHELSKPNDFEQAEIFNLKPDGTPVWDMQNVSKNSIFDGGEYKPRVWRAGEFRSGSIRNFDFVWKWGIHSGGEIIDVSTAENLTETLGLLEVLLNQEFDTLLNRIVVDQDLSNITSFVDETFIYQPGTSLVDEYFGYAPEDFPVFRILLNGASVNLSQFNNFVQDFIDLPYFFE